MASATAAVTDADLVLGADLEGPLVARLDQDLDPHLRNDAVNLVNLRLTLSSPGGSWEAGSGAIFDLNSHALRPDGWTSADAAGLPIFPGLRDDEIDRVLSVIACHSMVRANQALSSAEMQQLLKDLAEIDFGSCCPHGRPVMYRLAKRDVEKFFHRG